MTAKKLITSVMVFGVIFSVFVFSCSDDATTNGNKTVQIKRGLVVVGQAQVNTVPNTTEKFTVLYFETDDKATKGLPGENLTLKFLKDARDSKLAKNVVTTDSNGRADIEVMVGKNFPTNAPTTMQIEVSPQSIDTSRYKVDPIYLTLTVRPVGSSLKAVGPTERQGCVKQKVTLQVKMTQIDYTSKQTREIPLQGKVVTFGIVHAAQEQLSAKFDPSGGDTVQVETNLSGIASATLYAGDEARDYTILAQAEGVPSVQFHLVINSEESCVAGCKTSKDCGEGLICVNGECKSKDEPIACQTTKDCPSGYECINNVCETTTTCPPGYHLDPGGPGQSPSCVADNPDVKPCKTDADCPGPNYYCQDG
ncbi:MAG: EB domain-containing protein, partial [Myxococcota bacterium]